MNPRSAWYAAAAAVAASTSFAAAAVRPDSGTPTSALDGAQLFRWKGCAGCHDGPESNGMVPAGPSLADAPSWAGERLAGMSAEEYVAQSIRTPTAFISPAYAGSAGGPGAGQMPLLQISDGEIDAIVTFLLASSKGPFSSSEGRLASSDGTE